MAASKRNSHRNSSSVLLGLIICLLFMTSCSMKTSTTKSSPEIISSHTLIETNQPVPIATSTVTPAPTVVFSPTATQTPTQQFPVTEGTPVPASKQLLAESLTIPRELARWGKGSVTDAVYLPGGKQILLSAYTGLYLLDSNTLEMVSKLSDHPVLQVGLIDGGKTLITQDSDGLHSWDVQALTEKNSKLYQNAVRIVTSPSSNLFFVLFNDHVQALNADLQETTSFSVKTDSNSRNNRFLYGMFSNDGTLGGFLDFDNNFYTIDLKTSEMKTVKLADQDGHRVNHYFLTFSPDKQFVISTSDWGLWPWKLADGKRATFKDSFGFDFSYPDSPRRIWFSQDGSIFTIRGRGILQVISLLDHSAKQINIDQPGVDDYNGEVPVIRLSPDNKQILVVTDDIRMVLAADGSEIVRIPSFFSPRYAKTDISGLIAWQQKSIAVLSGNRLDVIDAETGSRKQSYPVNGSRPAFAFSNDGSRVLIAGEKLCMFEVSDGKQLVCGNPAWTPVFSSDDKWIAALGFNQVYLIDPNTLKPIQKLPFGTIGGETVSFTPDNKYVIASGVRSGIKMWNVYTGQLVQTISSLICEGNNAIYWSSDGSGFVFHAYYSTHQGNGAWTAEDMHNTVFRCDYKNGKATCNQGTSINWGPGWSNTVIDADRSLMARIYDGGLSLWNYTSSKELKLIEGKTSISDLTFSPDGRYLVTVGQDGLIRTWGIPEE